MQMRRIFMRTRNFLCVDFESTIIYKMMSTRNEFSWLQRLKGKMSNKKIPFSI